MAMFRILAVLLPLLAACASLTISDTQPLAPAQLEPPDGTQISRGGYRIGNLPAHGDTPDMLVLVAFSGGGKRSASFGYGALRGMRELSFATRSGPRPLLAQVSGMAGVSGGSFPAAYYGLYRDATFGGFERDFLHVDTNSYIYGIYLLPWNWTWLVEPDVGTNDFMDRVYDRTMFHGATFADLQQRGLPLVAIGATDLSYGTPFLFIQENFDLICADLSRFPIARAVAASNGFPGLFSPVTITNRAAECGGRKPAWLRAITAEERANPLSRAAVEAQRAERYLDPEKTVYLHLADGGISDNLALRAAGGLMQVATPRELRQRGFARIRRVLMISIDGEGGQDTSVARRREMGGLFSLLGLVSGAQIDRYNFETMIAVSDQIDAFERTLRDVRCAQARVIEGVACDDVKAALVHIALANMPDGPRKDRLMAIPTGLTVDRPDVDLLVQAGSEAVANSRPLRDFLDGYLPASPARAVARR